jgi:hypothetical protein
MSGSMKNARAIVAWSVSGANANVMCEQKEKMDENEIIT